MIGSRDKDINITPIQHSPKVAIRLASFAAQDFAAAASPHKRRMLQRTERRPLAAFAWRRTYRAFHSQWRNVDGVVGGIAALTTFNRVAVKAATVFHYF